jgi:hypothetical protein
MHHIVTVNPHGERITHEEFDEYGKATIRFCRIVLRHPGVHVYWVDGDVLPGLPDKIVAERFGNPCEAPCCVPLAEPWPEGPTVTNL